MCDNKLRVFNSVNKTVSPTAQDVYDHTSMADTGSMQPCGVCLYKHLTNVIRGHSLGILGMDLPGEHHPGQYLIRLASKLPQNRDSNLTLWD